MPTADDLDPDAQYILDGTLLPCWSWDGHKELYSGKHKTTGMNVQVACTIYGKLAWISDPVNGSRHDNYCREESGVLLTMNPRNWIGDKGYIGNNMITPFRKPAGGELLDWQKEYNSEVNKIRWMIEQVISHFKNWTVVPAPDYRRPVKTFETTILSSRRPALLPDGLNNPLRVDQTIGAQPKAVRLDYRRAEVCGGTTTDTREDVAHRRDQNVACLCIVTTQRS